MTDKLDHKYLHIVKPEDLIKLFITDDSEFEQLKTEMLNEGKEGIKAIQRNNLCTIVINAEIRGKFEISKIIKENCSKLLFINVKLFSFNILDSQLLATNNDNFSVIIEDCIIDRIHLENSIIGHFNIKNSTISELRIQNLRPISINIVGSSVKKIKIENSTIQIVLIENSTLEDFHFYFSTSQNFRIFKQSTIGFLCIHGAAYKELQILDSNIKQFDGRKLFCSLLIKSSIVPFCHLTNCSIAEFRIALFCKMAANITGGQINKLDFQKTGFNQETSISFSNALIYFILMDEFSMLGNLYFRKIIRAEKPFEWYDYENNIITRLDLDQGLLTKIFEQRKRQYDELRTYYHKQCKNLEGVINKPTIRISQTSLGKTEFTNCLLADFHFEYNSSKITDCFVLGGSIPTKNVHGIRTESNSIEEHQQKASFFNQFKKIFEAQGDIYHATQFQAKWADEQRKLLELIHKEEKGWFNSTYSDLWPE